MLNPTPADRLCDDQGRPYCLWDVDLSLADLRARLNDPRASVRAYWLGKVMRQARPDDALQLPSLEQMSSFGTTSIATWAASARSGPG
jgi:hypothetical protein